MTQRKQGVLDTSTVILMEHLDLDETLPLWPMVSAGVDGLEVVAVEVPAR